MFLNYPQAYSDESLGSWLWRLATANYLPSPRFILRELRTSVSPQTPVMREILSQLRESKLFHALAIWGNCSGEDIYKMTSHRFAHLLSKIPLEPEMLKLDSLDLPLLPSSFNRDFHSSRFVWCPHCLKEAQYVRLHWHLPFMTSCEKHQCWLLEACPICQHRLHEPDIHAATCPNCQYTLPTALAPSIPVGDLLLRMQKVMLAWAYSGQTTDLLNLEKIPPVTLLRVLHGLRYSAQRAGQTWQFHYQATTIPVPELEIFKQRLLSPFERGCLYATAFKALLDWPHGFFDFLDAYRERPMQKESSGLRREFGTLYISWFNRFWKYPHFDFIQEVFNDYLLKTIPHFQIVYSRRSQDYPDLLEKLNYLDLKRTVKYLKSSNLSVYRLVNTGHLKAEYFAGDDDGVWFAREDLDRLKLEWQDHLRFADLYRLLGPSKRLIHELLAVGLLQQVPENRALKRSGIYLYHHSLERLLEALRLQTQIVSLRPLNAVSILDLCIRLGSVKLDFAQVLQRILAGKLTAYHHTTSLLPLTELCFAFEDVQDLAEVLKNERDWFNKHETQRYLKTNARVLRQLMQANLLNPSVRLGPKLFFQRSQVYALRERWIFSREIAALLDLQVLSLRHLVKQGLFAEFTSSFPEAPNLNCFDRKAFMAWHEKHILLAEMKGLHPNLNTLSKLLRLRGIKPIPISSQIYLRKEVMPLMLEVVMNEQDTL